MYTHKGKTYPTFKMWAWMEGIKISALLLLAVIGIASPFLITGKLQREVESLHFFIITSHFSSAPTIDQKARYVKLAEQDARIAGIPQNLFVRQIALESGFDPNQVSDKGAVGIAQFMPDTAAELGVDPYDPTTALLGAAKLMAGYYTQYGDYAKALAAYNGGSGTLNTCIKNFGPLWETCEPQETQAYIATIMS